VRLTTHHSGRLQIPDFCPLIGHNPEFLLAFTGHNTLRRHLHLLWLTNSPLCRRCGAALAALRHVYLGSFFLDPKYINPSAWSDEHCSSCCTLSLIRLYLDNIGRKCNRAGLYVFTKEPALLWCGRQSLQIIV